MVVGRERGEFSGKGIYGDEATGQDVEKAGVVVVVAASLHVDEGIAGVQSVSDGVVIGEGAWHARGVVVGGLQQVAGIIYHGAGASEVVAHIIVMGHDVVTYYLHLVNIRFNDIHKKHYSMIIVSWGALSSNSHG